MVTHHQKTDYPSGTEKEKITEGRSAEAGKDDICRCKEVAVMKPRKLFGLMLSDLAFWKKMKKA